MQALQAVLLILATLGPLLVALASALAPLPSGPVAAVFPPWWDQKAAVASAAESGAVIRLGGLPFVVIVLATDRARLHSYGAWFLLDPRNFGGCSRFVD
jgi:hypothetical protein